MKLLLVDDHALFLEGLQYLLETYGIETACVANSGPEALEKARLLRPDIVLMDIKMPGMSGIDTLKLLKNEMPLSPGLAARLLTEFGHCGDLTIYITNLENTHCTKVQSAQKISQKFD